MGSKKKNAGAVSGSRNEQMYHSKNGRRKKARRREAVAVTGALALVFAVAVVCFIFFFKVQQISVVNSAERYTDEAIVSASGIALEESMLRLKPSAIAERITTELPYIESVDVKRRYPDKVTVTVSYARASLAVETDGGYVLMNDACKVLETGVQNISDYIAVVSGVEIASAAPGQTVSFTVPEMLGYVSSLSTAFSDHGFLNVTGYDFSDLFNITVEIDYRVDVKFGSIAHAAEKLEFGKAVIDSTLRDAANASAKLIVDLTTDNTAYVRSREDAERTEPTAEGETAEDDAQTQTQPTGENVGPVG